MRWRLGPPLPWDRKVMLSDNPDWEIDPAESWEAEQAFYQEHDLPPDLDPPMGRIATITHLANLVDYLINLVGDEHVALGGDVGGISADQWPLGLDHTGHLPRLTADLLGRGYGEDSLRRILSNNWYRIYRECLPT
jgi:membrane dipeptidase